MLTSGAGFTLDEATAAIDGLDVDWNEQAAAAAEQYLEFSDSTCEELLNQLSSSFGEKFTLEQATFGAESTGVC